MAEKLSDLTNILNGINDRLTPQNVTDAVDALSAAANISGISTQVNGNIFMTELQALALFY